MFKIKFKIYHESCWGSKINIEFPEHKFSSIDCRYIKDNVSHILAVQGNCNEFKNILNYLKSQEDTNSIEILSQSEDEIHFNTLTKNDDSHEQFSNLFFEKGCFMVESTKFIDKYEIWTFGTTRKEYISEIYNLISSKHPTKLIYLKKESLENSLTSKQQEALMHANHFGYFEWPRRKTISEISRILGISKTVFLSHLRKAENKIISNYINK